jgi:hypothetical protein
VTPRVVGRRTMAGFPSDQETPMDTRDLDRSHLPIQVTAAAADTPLDAARSRGW